MGGGVGIAATVVDVHDLDAGAAPQGPKQQPADAAKAVDAEFHVVVRVEPQSSINQS